MAKTKIMPKVKLTGSKPSVRSDQLRKSATMPVWQKRRIKEKVDKDNKIVPDNEGEFIFDL